MKEPRLTPEAQLAVDAAATEALRAGHAEVTREHVLRELVGLDSLWPTLLPLRFYRREIATLVTGHLQALPSSRAYRDGGTSVRRSPALTKALQHVGRGVLFFTRRVDEAALLDALLDDPVIVASTGAARLDLTDLDPLLDQARETASERRHLAVHFEHVLRLMVDQRWLIRALHAVGGDSSALRSRLDRVLDAYPVVGRGKESVPTKLVEQLLLRARAHAKRLGRPATSDLLMVFALQHGEARRIFDEAHVPAWDLLTTLVHGVGPGPIADADNSETYVVFHDDEVTTQEFVTELLRETFALDEERAKAAMLEAHANGAARVASYPRMEASERVSTALALARNAGFPLRITLHEKDGDASG